MVLIELGTFQMGSLETERGRDANEGPIHEVTLTRSFYIGKYEITQAQWQAVTGVNPSEESGIGDNLPVYGVSSDDCQSFIEQLNALGLGTFRLPTEAEWEYACRAGTGTRFSFGDVLECSDLCSDCELMEEHMWWCGNETGEAHEVGLGRWYFTEECPGACVDSPRRQQHHAVMCHNACKHFARRCSQSSPVTSPLGNPLPNDHAVHSGSNRRNHHDYKCPVLSARTTAAALSPPFHAHGHSTRSTLAAAMAASSVDGEPRAAMPRSNAHTL